MGWRKGPGQAADETAASVLTASPCSVLASLTASPSFTPSLCSQAYVNELAGILVESDNPSAGATQGAVKRLVDEACLLTTRAALCNPPGAKHFALTKARSARLSLCGWLVAVQTGRSSSAGGQPAHPVLASQPSCQVDDVPGQPADARVPQIARALDVSPQQRRQLGQLRGLYLQKLGRIAAERQELNSQLLVRRCCCCSALLGAARR